MKETLPHLAPAGPADEEFLFLLYASTRADELQSWGWDEPTLHSFLSLQWLAQNRSYAMLHPNADHRIIFFRNNRIGRSLVDRTVQEIRLVDISLLPEFRNLGIGTQFLQELQLEAAAERKPLRLSVRKLNPARHLYDRLGFSAYDGDELYDFMEWCAANNMAVPSDKSS